MRRGSLPRSAAPPDRTEQRSRALDRANEIRLARAELKRKIASGEIFVASVLLELPAEACSWEIGELLRTQRRWGVKRAHRFLASRLISETKPLARLTERQRRMLARELGGAGSDGEPT